MATYPYHVEPKLKGVQKINNFSSSRFIESKRGAIEYMTCNEEKCLPFNYKFEILINHQD